MKKRHLYYLVSFTLINFIINIVGFQQVLVINPLIFIITGVITPLLGICLWFTTLPFGFLFSNTLQHINIISLCIGLIINIIFSKNIIIDRKIIVFIFSYALISTISLLVNNGHNFNLYFILLTSILAFYLFSYFFKNNSSVKLEQTITITLLSTGISILLYVLVDYLRGNEVLLFGRLSIGGNIRVVANYMPYPFIFIFYNLLYGQNMKQKKYKLLQIILMLMFLIGLLLTGSRGVILALMLTILVLIVFKLNKITTIKSLALVMMFSIIAYLFIGGFDSSQLRLERITGMESSGRSFLWSSVISEFFDSDIITLIFGMGLGSFYLLADEGIYGLGTYAHSVFVDTFISLGLLGFISLFSLLIIILLINLRQKNILGFSILLLTVIVFFNHGDAQNLLFFFYLSIAYSLGTIKKEQQKLHDNT